MNHKKLMLACFSAVLLASVTAQGADLFGVTWQNELYTIDSQTGATTQVGVFSLPKDQNGLSDLARHLDGTLYGISESKASANVYSVNDQTGAATLVHSLGGPTSAIGAAVDPTDGSLWFANTAGFVWWPSLTRMDLGTGNMTFPGFIAPTAQNYTGLAFDGTGQLYSLNANQNALWKVDKNNPTNSVIVGTGLGKGFDLTFGAALWRDPASGLIMGYAVSGNVLFIVDLQTGLGTAIGTTATPPTEFRGVASGAGTPGCGIVFPYGVGCAGSGGFIPSLSWSGCSAGGNSVSVSITNGLGGSSALLVFGLGQGSTFMGDKCYLLVNPLLPAIISLPLGGVGPGNGSVTIGGMLPPGASGAHVTMQSFVIDPAGNPIGGSASNGLDISIL